MSSTLMSATPMPAALGDLGGRGFTASSRPDNQQVFLRAKRHSRMVRVLRVAVPVAVLLVLVVIIAASWLDPLRIIARLPTGGPLVISGTKITMASPKLSGYTKDSRAYEFNARAAMQDITKPNVVELSDIRAKIQSKDDAHINLTAVDGVYDRKSGILKLARDIVLTSGPYEANLAEATVDTTSNNVVSEQPVQVKFPQGRLNSKRLEVVGGGEIVRFIGDVKMNLDAPAEQGGNRTGSR